MFYKIYNLLTVSRRFNLPPARILVNAYIFHIVDAIIHKSYKSTLPPRKFPCAPPTSLSKHTTARVKSHGFPSPPKKTNKDQKTEKTIRKGIEEKRQVQKEKKRRRKKTIGKKQGAFGGVSMKKKNISSCQLFTYSTEPLSSGWLWLDLPQRGILSLNNPLVHTNPSQSPLVPTHAPTQDQEKKAARERLGEKKKHSKISTYQVSPSSSPFFVSLLITTTPSKKTLHREQKSCGLRLLKYYT